MNVCRVGIIGLGTVGQGVVELLRRNAGLYESRCGRRVEVVAALVRDAAKTREFIAEGARLSADAESFFGVESDVIVEVAGGVEPARMLIQGALGSGRDVVTANKALLALHASELFALAEARRRRLLFEASVAGGVPVVKVVAEALASNRIESFAGILNGTCNFILSAMSRGGAYEEALNEAQRLGFAEADPDLDVSGRDSVEKLAILATLAFGVEVKPDSITSDGITKMTQQDVWDAAERRCAVKLLACGRRSERSGEIELWSGPTFVPVASPLASVNGSDMGLMVAGDAMARVFVSGDGAGRFPTASAVVADLLEAARLMDVRPGGGARLNVWPTGAPAAVVSPMKETIASGKRGAMINEWRGL